MATLKPLKDYITAPDAKYLEVVVKKHVEITQLLMHMPAVVEGCVKFMHEVTTTQEYDAIAAVNSFRRRCSNLTQLYDALQFTIEKFPELISLAYQLPLSAQEMIRRSEFVLLAAETMQNNARCILGIANAVAGKFQEVESLLDEILKIVSHATSKVNMLSFTKDMAALVKFFTQVELLAKELVRCCADVNAISIKPRASFAKQVATACMTAIRISALAEVYLDQHLHQEENITQIQTANGQHTVALVKSDQQPRATNYALTERLEQVLSLLRN